MRAFITILSLSILSGNIWSQSIDNYLAARACMTQNNYDSATHFLDMAILANQSDADLYMTRGICNFELNNYARAYEDFYQAERRRSGMASFYLAKTEVRLNHPEQAIKYIRIHLDSRYKLPEMELLLDEDINTLETRDDWKTLWNEKEWYNTNDEDFQKALYLEKSGDYLEAINVLNDLEKKGYKKSEVLTLKAEMFGLLGNEKAMASEIDKAVTSDVRNHKALYLRAKINLDNKNYEEALSDCNKLIRVDPANFDAYLIRAFARSGTGDLKGAVEDIDNYLVYFPKNDSAYFLKGKIQYTHRKYLNALQSLNKALEMNTGNALYFHYRGLVYASTGTLQYAEKDFSMALDLDPYNAETWFEKGKVSARLGKLDDACHDYKKAYQYGLYDARDYIDKNCPGNE